MERHVKLTHEENILSFFNFSSRLNSSPACSKYFFIGLIRTNSDVYTDKTYIGIFFLIAPVVGGDPFNLFAKQIKQ